MSAAIFTAVLIADIVRPLPRAVITAAATIMAVSVINHLLSRARELVEAHVEQLLDGHARRVETALQTAVRDAVRDVLAGSHVESALNEMRYQQGTGRPTRT